MCIMHFLLQVCLAFFSEMPSGSTLKLLLHVNQEQIEKIFVRHVIFLVRDGITIPIGPVFLIS